VKESKASVPGTDLGQFDPENNDQKKFSIKISMCRAEFAKARFVVFA
jgi:hypothetical protein